MKSSFSLAASDYTSGRREIIKEALVMVGHDRTPYTHWANAALNDVIKGLQSRGVLLWAIEEVIVTFTASSEIIGDDSENYICYRPVTASTSNKPITGAEWSAYYYKGGTNGTAWADGAIHTSISVFGAPPDTLSIDRAFIRRDERDSEPLDIISGKNFMRISSKQTEGIPSKLYFQYDVNGNHVIRLFPQPMDTNMVLHYFRAKKLKDYDTKISEKDFPEHWTTALVFMLASRLSFRRDLGLTLQEQEYLRTNAELEFKKAKGTNREKTSNPGVRSIF